MLPVVRLHHMAGTRLLFRVARHHRQVARAHDRLPQDVDAVQEVPLVPVLGRHVVRLGPDGGEELAHEVLPRVD